MGEGGYGGGMDIDQIKTSIRSGDEYKGLNPFDEGSARQFLTNQYANYFDRDPNFDTADGARYWLDHLRKGWDAGQTLEARRSGVRTGLNASNEAFVTNLYRANLNRSPDEGGRAHWMGALKSGQTREKVEADFLKAARTELNAGKETGGHSDFTHSGGMSTQALVEWHNPTTGETWTAPNGGYSPKEGTDWVPKPMSEEQIRGDGTNTSTSTSQQADDFLNGDTGGTNQNTNGNDGNQNLSVTQQAENLLNMANEQDQRSFTGANAYLSGENVDSTTAGAIRLHQLRQGIESGTIDINDLTPKEQAYFSDTVALTPEQRMKNQVTNWYRNQNITPDDRGVNYWVSQLAKEGADFDTVLGHFNRTAEKDKAARAAA
jgi:hypothetical protein